MSQRKQPDLGFKINQTYQNIQKYQKNGNNRVTQEGYEDLFEDIADKNDKEDYSAHKNSNKQQNKTERKKKSTWKTRRCLRKLNFTDSESHIFCQAAS